MLFSVLELRIVCGCGSNICMNDRLAPLTIFRDSL